MAFCVRLGFWQFDRYEFRHQLTQEINVALSEQPVELTGESQKTARAWRYGLEVLSLFIPSDDTIPPIWVDRGWIETNRSAATDIPIPKPSNEQLTITGILKKYDDLKESKGVFFALPAPRVGRIDEETLQKTYSGETFFTYLKLNNSSDSGSADALPIAPLSPPGEGPHLAYAIQWWLFALLIAGTRFALYRGERSL